MGKIIPSKKQWKKWTLPAKASYLGFRLGILLTVLLWALPPIDYSIFIKDSKPAFSKTDKDFKILIMSFHGFGNSDNDIGEVLKHRLDSL